jgi:cyclomaltodextrinase
MNFSALYHVSDYTFCQVQSNGELLIKLRTGNDKIDKIILYYGDPFYGVKDELGRWVWVKQYKQMDFIGSGEFNSYYQVRVKPLYKRCRYYFEIFAEGKSYFYGEKGVYNSSEVNKDNFFGFSYPYVHLSDSYNPPKWLKNTIWYEIFPDRFCNGDKTNDIKGTLNWNESLPTAKTFFGGDLRGIINKLDYLEKLGITGIYLTPIFLSPSTHKYDTVDYMQIDPGFGTKEELKELVLKAHNKGIRIILDAVFNHSSNLFEPFLDVTKNQEKSEYKDWFYIKHFPINASTYSHDKTNLDYETFAFASNMPKLNTENKDTEEYLINVATYWIKETNIDGFRIDVANEQPHRFWRRLREEIKKVKEDAVLIGESWSNSMTWLYGEQFDSVMNYMFTNLVTDYVARNVFDTSTFIKRYIDIYNVYPSELSKNLFNLLDSHDTHRIVSICNNDIYKIKKAYALLFTYPGTPCIYYGGEIGLEGHDDPDCRRCMIWNEKDWNHEINDYIHKLIAIRKEYAEIFIHGDIEIKEEDCLVISRKYLNQKIKIYIYDKKVNTNKNDAKLIFESDNIVMEITQV